MTIYIYVYIIYHVSIVSTCIYSIYRFWVVLSDDAGGTGKKNKTLQCCRVPHENRSRKSGGINSAAHPQNPEKNCYV